MWDNLEEYGVYFGGWNAFRLLWWWLHKSVNVLNTCKVYTFHEWHIWICELHIEKAIANSNTEKKEKENKAINANTFMLTFLPRVLDAIWINSEWVSDSHSVGSDSLWSHGLQPTRLLCPWDSPGQNPAVGSPRSLSALGCSRTCGKSGGVAGSISPGSFRGLVYK